MFSLTAIKSSFPLWFYIVCKDSKATKILSEISRLFVKALWYSVMILGIIILSLLHKTFKKILYNTLHKLMGLYLETDSGHLTLRIKLTKLWLRCGGREVVFRN